VEATRKHPDIVLGASTRAALGLYRAAQAAALLDGRDFAVPDDVKKLAIPVLAHRLLSKRWSQGMRDDAAATALCEILEATNVPV
jgi:MoxR-like ATPase